RWRGMYEVTSIPLVRRTRATLRSAEFGFFGVVVYTRTHTPRFCGEDISAGAVVLRRCLSRPLFTSWLMVGIENCDILETESRKSSEIPEFLRDRGPRTGARRRRGRARRGAGRSGAPAERRRRSAAGSPSSHLLENPRESALSGPRRTGAACSASRPPSRPRARRRSTARSRAESPG